MATYIKPVKIIDTHQSVKGSYNLFTKTGLASFLILYTFLEFLLRIIQYDDDQETSGLIMMLIQK